MATVTAPPPVSKHDAFLMSRLDRASKQVRSTDLLLGLLGLVTLVAGYSLAMIFLDRWLVLPAIVRQLALGGLIVGAGVYLFVVLIRPLLATVNPYYAARQVERTLPGSKNSLINWLDLRDRPLAPLVRAAVSDRAAEDLSHADIEEAVRDRRLASWSIASGLMLVAVIVAMLFLRPGTFFSLLSRAFVPFSSTAIAEQTQIKLIEPANGNIGVPIHHPVDIRVEISGRIPRADSPDACRLRLRYTAEDPTWEERRMEPGDSPNSWSIRVPSNEVRNGFEYQVAAGDAFTTIYRVNVRAKALITDFDVRYHYRPYLRYADDVRKDPNLEAEAGTEITLTARTNRTVKDGVLRLTSGGTEQSKMLSATVSSQNPDAMRFQFTMEREGQYRLQFTAMDGERNDETLPYEIRIVPDLPPEFDWIQKAPESLPVNGTMALACRVTDRHGLTGARLLLKYKSSPDAVVEPLPPMTHRAGKPWKLANGADPKSVEIKEVVPLDKLTDSTGKLIELRAGAQVYYQFEAEDNCDYPKPQTGRSTEHMVTLGDPQPREKRDGERDQANKDKEQHDQKQEQERNNQGNQGKDDQKSADANPEGGSEQSQAMDQQDAKTLDDAKRIANELQKQAGKNQSKPANDANNKSEPKDPGNDNSNPQEKRSPNQVSKDQPSDRAKSDPQDKSGKHDKQSKSDSQAKQDESSLKNLPKQENGKSDKSQREQDPAGQKPNPLNQDEKHRPNNKAGAPDQKESKPDQMKPDSQGSKTPQPKPDEKSDKSGEKPSDGAIPEKPNDKDPKSSPREGNAQGGQPGSQRADANPKAHEKSDKPKEIAKSGQPDEKSPRPDSNEPKGPTGGNKNDQKPDAKSKSDSGTSKSEPKNGDAEKSNSQLQNADKPHEQPGSKSKSEPKTEGTPAGGSKSEPKEKPKDSDAKPADVQKLIDQFEKADPKTQQKIIEKLQEMAKNAPSPQDRKAAQEAAKECQGKCDNPSNAGGKSQPKDKSGNQQSPTKSGQKSNENAQPGNDKRPGENQMDQSNVGSPKAQSGDKSGKQGAAKSNNQDEHGQPSEQPGKTGQENDKQSSEPRDQTKDQTKADKADRSKNRSDQAGKFDNEPGMAHGKREGEASKNATAPSEAAKDPNENYLREAGELQLETFRNKVDRNVLERLKMSDEEYDRFLRAYQDLIKRSKEQPKGEKGDKVRGANRGGSTVNAGAKKVESGSKSGPKTDRGGRGAAPPEFREQYREFTEDQAKSKSGKP